MIGPSPACFPNTVDVYQSYAGRDTDGGIQFPYPVPPSLPAVPCSVQAVSSTETEDQGRITKIVTYEVMFGSFLGLSPRDMIVYRDPGGIAHFLFAKADRDEAGRWAAFTVFCEERV